jgi:hypothetical protein
MATWGRPVRNASKLFRQRELWREVGGLGAAISIHARHDHAREPPLEAPVGRPNMRIKTFRMTIIGYRWGATSMSLNEAASALFHPHVGYPPRLCENASCLIESGTKSWRLGCPDLSKVVTVVK